MNADTPPHWREVRIERTSETFALRTWFMGLRLDADLHKDALGLWHGEPMEGIPTLQEALETGEKIEKRLGKKKLSK